MVDASAYRTYVYYGESQVDVTPSLVSFDVGDELRGLEGGLPFSGDLVLADGPELPDIVNPRRNPSKLYKGDRFLIKVALAATGEIVTHTRGWLYVTAEPNEPTPDAPEITFELGCELTLQDWVAPSDDPESEFDGIVSDRGAAVSILLQYAKLRGVWLGNIPAHGLNYPLERGGGFIERAYKVAFGGLQYIHQRNNGNIYNRSIALDNLTPSRTFYLGQDEVEYKSNVGGEPLCEEMKISGVGHKLHDNYQATSYTSRQTGLAQMIDPNQSGVIVIRVVNGLETNSGVERKQTETTTAPGGIVAPTTYPKSLGLITAESRNTTYHYERNDERRLTKIESYAYAPFESAARGYFDAQVSEADKAAGIGGNTLTSESSLTEYFYDDEKGVVKRVEATTRQPIGAIVSDEDYADYARLIIAERTIVEYTETNEGVWKRETVIYAPAASVGNVNLTGEFYESVGAEERAAVKASLVVKESKTEISNAGQCTPPSPERGMEPYTITEYPLEATVRFSLQAPFQERIKPLQVETAVSEVQLAEIGQIVGAVLIGRARGVEFQLPLDDELVQAQDPLPIWKFVFPDGSADIVQVNGLQFSHDADKAIVAGLGIKLATQPAGSNALIAPYPAIEIIADGGTEDGSEPEVEIIVTPPPIVVQHLVFGSGAGFAVDFTEIEHRPSWVTSFASASGYEVKVGVDVVLPEKETRIGSGIGLFFQTRNRRTLRESYFGTGSGLDIGRLTEIPILASAGIGIGGMSQRLTAIEFGSGSGLIFGTGNPAISVEFGSGGGLVMGTGRAAIAHERGSGSGLIITKV